jgi:hypothetical protein
MQTSTLKEPAMGQPTIDAPVFGQCRHCFGLGVIVADEPGHYSTWEEMMQAIRQEPDPERLNEFLSQPVAQPCRERISKCFR